MICLKNNTTQLYFTQGRAKLRWNFSSIPTDGSDIHRFSNRKWVFNHVQSRESMTSMNIQVILDKFHCRSTLPNFKYNCIQVGHC